VDQGLFEKLQNIIKIQRYLLWG